MFVCISASAVDIKCFCIRLKCKCMLPVQYAQMYTINRLEQLTMCFSFTGLDTLVHENPIRVSVFWDGASTLSGTNNHTTLKVVWVRRLSHLNVYGSAFFFMAALFVCFQVAMSDTSLNVWGLLGLTCLLVWKHVHYMPSNVTRFNKSIADLHITCISVSFCEPLSNNVFRILLHKL